MNVRNICQAITFALVASSAQAHPGHEPFSEGSKHFIANPNHVLPPLLFGAVMFFAAFLLKRRGERIFLRIAAMAIVVVALLS